MRSLIIIQTDSGFVLINIVNKYNASYVNSVLPQYELHCSYIASISDKHHTKVIMLCYVTYIILSILILRILFNHFL